MRNYITYSTTLVLLTFWPYAVRAQNAVTYQLDLAHDGAVTIPSFSPALKQLWSVHLANVISYPLIVNGEVYVTSGNSAGTATILDAFNGKTGQVDWSASIPGLNDMAAYDNGAIYSFDGNGMMNAYNATSGTQLWSQSVPFNNIFSSPPTAANGLVFLAGSGVGGTFYAKRESDGTTVFNSQVLNGNTSSAAVVGQSVYVSYVGPQVYSFNTQTGVQNWHYNSGAEGGGGAAPVYYNGNLYVNSLIGPLVSLNPTTGVPSQTFTFALHDTFTVPAFSNGMGYQVDTVSGVGVLEAFSPVTGNLNWTYSVPGGHFLVESPIIVNGYVFDVTDDGFLDEFNGTTGALLASFNTGGAYDTSAASSPQLGLAAGDGLLAAPIGETLTVYAIPEPSAIALASLGAALLIVLARRRRRMGASQAWPSRLSSDE